MYLKRPILSFNYNIFVLFLVHPGDPACGPQTGICLARRLVRDEQIQFSQKNFFPQLYTLHIYFLFLLPVPYTLSLFVCFLIYCI